MASIVDLLRSFCRLFIWWVVIQPWELGLRVRLGNHQRVLKPGIHFRIPYLDSVYKQSVRLRWTTLTSQTVTTKDGFTLTMAGQLGYEIVNLERLYDTLHQAENALRSIGAGAIAQYIHVHDLNDCTPLKVQEGAGALLNIEQFGIRFCTLQLTTFCRVKTYRFIMDYHENIWDDLLNTSADDSPKPSPR